MAKEHEGLYKVHKVVAKVVSQKGTCNAGHKVGDEWVIGLTTPEGICLSAYNAVFPAARVLMLGGAHPWETDPDISISACPDARNPVVFEVRRVKE